MPVRWKWRKCAHPEVNDREIVLDDATPTTAGAMSAADKSKLDSLSTGAGAAIYGNGVDGAATFNGVATPAGATKDSATQYTLTRDVYYTTMTVSAGVTVKTAGYRVFANVSITNNGILDNSGSDGTTPTGGAGAPTGSLGGGTAGGDSTAAGGNAGTNDTQSLSAAGGAGGDGTGGTGGAGGTASAPTADYGGIYALPHALIGAFIGLAGVKALHGGVGGGGGAGSGVPGGGGGGGGGVMSLATPTLTNSGTIRANGGAGSLTVGAGRGGGGGGSGGTIVIVSGSTSYGTVQVNGGAGGAGGGTGGADGVAGGVGKKILLVN